MFIRWLKRYCAVKRGNFKPKLKFFALYGGYDKTWTPLMDPLMDPPSGPFKMMFERRFERRIWKSCLGTVWLIDTGVELKRQSDVSASAEKNKKFDFFSLLFNNESVERIPREVNKI